MYFLPKLDITFGVTQNQGFNGAGMIHLCIMLLAVDTGVPAQHLDSREFPHSALSLVLHCSTNKMQLRITS